MKSKYLFLIFFFSLCNLKEYLLSSESENEKILIELYYACIQDNFNLIQDIIESNAHKAITLLNSQIPHEHLNNSLLHTAAKHNSINAALVLLDQHANINAKNKLAMTPLHYAIHNKHISMITLLLFYNASRNIQDLRGKNAFDYALSSHNQAIIELLYPPIHQQNITPSEKTFHFSARYGPCIAASLAALTLLIGIPLCYQ